MATECEITMAVEQAPIRMFDLAKRKHGITRKVLNLETGIAISTLRSYEEGTSMPVSALVKMARVIPNELLSLMLDVGGKVIADAEPDPADTSIHQMQTGVFFNTSGTTSGADVSGNTFDYITQDAIRFHRAILECNVSHNICKGYNSSASTSFAAINIINTSGLGNAITRSVIQGNTGPVPPAGTFMRVATGATVNRSDEHTSELQSLMRNLLSRLLLDKKNKLADTQNRRIHDLTNHTSPPYQPYTRLKT